VASCCALRHRLRHRSDASLWRSPDVFCPDGPTNADLYGRAQADVDTEKAKRRALARESRSRRHNKKAGELNILMILPYILIPPEEVARYVNGRREAMEKREREALEAMVDSWRA
jgi:hypothetical protein